MQTRRHCNSCCDYTLGRLSSCLSGVAMATAAASAAIASAIASAADVFSILCAITARRLTQWVNSTDNDGAALQRAIDDAATPSSSSAGCSVFVPRGVFHLNTTVRLHAGALPTQVIGGGKHSATRSHRCMVIARLSAPARSSKAEPAVVDVASLLARTCNRTGLPTGLARCRQGMRRSW